MSLSAKSLLLLATAVSGMKYKLAVEPAPSGNIVQTSYCGASTAAGSAPVHFPGRCYVKQDGPEAGKISQEYSCNGTQVVGKVYQTGDCSGDSVDMPMQAGQCLGYSSYECIAAKADTTYITIYSNSASMSTETCAAGMAGTFEADGICSVFSVMGYGKLVYDTCGTIQWTQFSDTCVSKVGHWIGKSAECAARVAGSDTTALVSCVAGAAAPAPAGTSSDTKGLLCSFALIAAFAVATQ